MDANTEGKMKPLNHITTGQNENELQQVRTKTSHQKTAFTEKKGEGSLL